MSMTVKGVWIGGGHLIGAVGGLIVAVLTNILIVRRDRRSNHVDNGE
ncbi:MAG: hypothetical protein ACKV0T_12140 [Planctomycetales bacterium]